MRIDSFLSGSRAAQFSRRLRFESLERRQLLTVTVDTLVDEADGSIDDGDVSLRDAIANAPAGETIDFSVTGTINLTLGQLVIFKDLNISGPGPGQLTIDAAGNDATPGTPDGMGSRIFLVNDFDSGVDLNVSIGGVTLRNGDVDTSGGAIYNRENLTVTNVVLSDNVSELRGGAIYSDGAMLSITSSIIDQNTSVNGGGGVSATQFLSLAITDSTISNNTATSNNLALGGGGLGVFTPQIDAVISISGSTINSNGSNSNGGGLFFDLEPSTQTFITDTEITDNSTTGFNGSGGGAYIENGSVSIESSHLTGNTATFGGGGAYLTNGTINILNTTVDANHSDYLGGGLWVSSGDVTITNSTVSGNTAGGVGGGISAAQGTQILHSTIVGNTTDDTSLSAGGGIYFGTPSDTTIQGTVSNSIVAGNFKDGGLSDSDIAGTILADYNLIKSSIGVTVVGPGNILGFDPMIGPLQDNGGPTPTHELLSGSPAIDAGDPSAVANMSGVPEFDQRGSGFGRVEDGDGMNGPRLDIGAYEVCGIPIESADFDGDGFVTGLDFLDWQIGFGIPAPDALKTDGDADNDLDVDANDLGVWESQYGTAAPAVSAVSRLSPRLVDLAMMMDNPQTRLDTNRTEVDLPEPYLEVTPDSVSGAPALLPQRDTAQPATVSVASAEEELATKEDVAVLSELFFSDL